MEEPPATPMVEDTSMQIDNTPLLELSDYPDETCMLCQVCSKWIPRGHLSPPPKIRRLLMLSFLTVLLSLYRDDKPFSFDEPPPWRLALHVQVRRMHRWGDRVQIPPAELVRVPLFSHPELFPLTHELQDGHCSYCDLQFTTAERKRIDCGREAHQQGRHVFSIQRRRVRLP